MKSVRFAVILLSMTFGLLALLSPVQAADPPSIWVSQTRGLAGGDVVRVVGRGITPRASVSVIQCDSYLGDYDYDCQPSATVTAGTYGALSVRIALQDPAYRNEPFGSATPVYCRADTCRIYLAWTDAAGDPQVVSSQRLLFRGSPTSVTATPSSDLVDGQVVRVSGSSVGAAGRLVSVVQHGCFSIIQGTGCYGELETRTTRVRPGGSWSLLYTVHRVLGDGESDCTDPDILGSCVISATVLDAAGNADDSFGVASIGDAKTNLSFAPDPS